MAIARRNRPIEVFDQIALVAVVTKAMGAFLIIMLVLLRYYNLNPDELRKTLGDSTEKLSITQKELDKLRAEHEDFRWNQPSRRFAVFVLISDCNDAEFELYIRYEGGLQRKAGETLTAQPFDATAPGQKEVLVGDLYYNIGGRRLGDVYSGGEDASDRLTGFLQQAAQIKGFNSSGTNADSWFSAYLALKPPHALGQRECVARPTFVSGVGRIIGKQMRLSEKRPFAWLARFQIDAGGSIRLQPPQSNEFQQALAEFSNRQSVRLCQQRIICDAEDAHYAALRIR